MNTVHIELLHEVVDFWFPNADFQSFWFSSEYDIIIRQKYQDITNILSNVDNFLDLLNFATHTKTLCIKACIGIVICLDQFNRNLNRIIDGVNDRSIYKKTDNLCIAFVKHVFNNSYENYPIHQRIFLLMPYRHQRTSVYLDYVMTQIVVMENESTNNKEQIIISKFKNATIRDYSNVTDTIQHHINIDDNKYLDNVNINVLDDYCLTNYNLNCFNHRDVSNSKLYKVVHEFIKLYNIKNVCISLSGGVDSMVISYILRQMLHDKIIDCVVAVHLNYNNRDVANCEARIVHEWCKTLNIPLLMRVITHMKRSDNIERTLYEQETKKIRFGLYNEAKRLYNVTSVMLGHHMDDLTENVLMNVIQGGDILNLFTMRDHQLIDGVLIDRPLLSVRKNDIFDFAHEYEIPYFKDTTLSHCMRGIIRKTVIPALEKFNVCNNLMNIGEQSMQLNTTFNNQMINPILSSAKKYSFGFTIEFNDSYVSFDESIWRKVLIELFHRNGTKMMSNKNLVNFIQWVNKNNKCLFRCHEYIVTFYTDKNHKKYLVFYKHDYSMTKKEVVTTVDDIVIDNWHITFEKVTNNTNNTNNFIDIIDILNGQFSYYVTGSIDKKINYSVCENRVMFKDISLNRYIPQIHFNGKADAILYKVNYRYIQ